LQDLDIDPPSPRLEQFRLANLKNRPPIFDAEALHDTYEDFAWPEPSNWIDTQVDCPLAACSCVGRTQVCWQAKRRLVLVGVGLRQYV
jgi:hypothetical protein